MPGSRAFFKKENSERKLNKSFIKGKRTLERKVNSSFLKKERD
jgi:hypothetical protein